MEIGKPRRIYRIEPLKNPVPTKRDPAEEPPVTVPRKPHEVPAK